MEDTSQRITNLSPARLALLSKLLQKKAVVNPAAQTIGRRPDHHSAPLSFSQQRMWFFDQLEPGNPFYNESLLAVRLIGSLHVDALRKSIAALVQRHESLRTTFTTINETPVQVIAPELPLDLQIVDLSGVAEEQQSAAVDRVAVQEAQHSFDLLHGPLLRTTLVQLSERLHVLMIARHHIISDAWSTEIMIHELATHYAAILKHQPAVLPDLPIQYPDFAYWQREWMQGPLLDQQIAFWKQQLAGAPMVLELPADHPRPAEQRFHGQTQRVTLPPALAAALKTLSHREGVTLFMTLLAAFAAMLHRYTGQTDLLIGTPIANRTRVETERLIGFLGNTLVLRVDLSGTPSFREVLGRVREMSLAAYAHQDLPFEKLVEELQPPRDLSRTPLIQVMFVVHNAPAGAVELPNLMLVPLEIESGTSKFDLTLSLLEEQDSLRAVIEYSTDLFEAGTIARMLGHFEVLLAAASADPAQPIASLPLLTEAERQQQLLAWNDTAAAFDSSACLHDLFASQVAHSPDALALICGSERLTYRELERRANQLAHLLVRLGVRPDQPVGLCLTRSAAMVVGLLGIVKAGGAYLPLDPRYPLERLTLMLQDARVQVLVTEAALRERLPETAAQVVYLDRDHQRIAAQPDCPPCSGVQPANLAYLIYTSGSTGRPKGVMLDHRGRVSNFTDFNQRFAIGSHDRLLGISSLSFDMCAYDVFGSLAAGATVILPEAARELDVAHWAELMVQHGITVWHSVPALLEMLVDYIEGRPDLHPHALRVVLLGGDWIPITLPDRLKSIVEGVRVISLGGATEVSMDSTIYEVRAHNPAWPSIPYGVPMANQLAYILDRQHQLVPSGVPGELHLGGVGVAWGYFDRPDLTAERFIPNPFAPTTDDRRPTTDSPVHPLTRSPAHDGGQWSVVGGRLYKTGDLARYLPDGTLQLLGRIDNQVKIGGLRIELGEIEAALRKCPAVRETIVVARANAAGRKQLVAYVIPDQEQRTRNKEQNGQEPRTENQEPTSEDSGRVPSGWFSVLGSGVGELRAFLKDKLPEYMIPAAFVMLDALPLTPNGKLDRRNLPAPDADARVEGAYAAPRTATEQALAGIWSQLLGQAVVGIHDNFFALGGDSILSIQVVAKARQAGIDVTAKQLFQHQTIAELAAVAGSAPQVTAEQGLIGGTAPLTPMQAWFFEQHFTDAHHWNQAFLLKSRRPIVAAQLEAAINHLLAHHDALRIRFAHDRAGWRQVGATAEQHGVFSSCDLRTLPADEQSTIIEATANKLHASLNLTAGPLMRAVLFELGQEQRLLIIIHHLVVDSISWQILLADLTTAYEQLDRQEAPHLPAKTTSYLSLARQLAAHARSPHVRDEARYWSSQAWSDVAALPRDDPGGANSEASAATLTIALDVEASQFLLQQLPAYRTQPDELLLAALARALAPWCQGRPLPVSLERHGRDIDLAGVDLSRTVGWCTARFPALIDISATGSPAAALKAVKEQMRAVPGSGASYGVLRYLGGDSDLAADLRSHPAAEVSFSYLGQANQGLAQSALFELAAGPYGQLHSLQALRSYLLMVDWTVSDGNLQLFFTYSEQIYRRSTIAGLAQDFVVACRELIRACRAARSAVATPSDFPLAQLDQRELDRLLADNPGVEDIYPLAPMQRNMLLNSRFRPRSGLYINQAGYPLSKDLDVAAFEQAWKLLVARHACLRTSFVWDGTGAPHQIVHEQVPLALEQHDWRDLPIEEQQARLARLLAAGRLQGFDLTKAPLLRPILVRLSEDTYQFMLLDHYMIQDAWSALLLRRDLLACYTALLAGQEPQLAPARPYRDYIAWVEQQDQDKARAFWRAQLTGFAAPTPLPAPARPTIGEPLFGKQAAGLPEAATRQLHALARREQVTPSILVQGAWALLLQSYSGGEDIVYGITSSGRPATLAGVESIAGLLINTLPVRVRIQPEAMLTTWLKSLQHQQIELQQYEYLPLPEIVACSDVPAGTHLFHSILVFENYPVDASLRELGRSIDSTHPLTRQDYSIAQTEFPIRVDIGNAQSMSLAISYYRDCLDDGTIAEMLDRFTRLLELIAERQDGPLALFRGA